MQSCTASTTSCAPVPIGVFWDIENCGIPFHKSALSFVQKIREKFFRGRKEAEFMCVCDTSNQNKDTIQELNDAQVTVVHISAVSKNTADDKIRQSLRRFAADYVPPADVILISGDVNFASDLSDLRYRHHIHIILIHRRHVAVALTSCAHECYCFEDFVSDLPTRTLPQSPEVMRELVVNNLPVGIGVQNRLQRMCKGVRGRILNIDGPTALIRFPTNDAALRAQKILDGESVLGQKIEVLFPGPEKLTPKAARKQTRWQTSAQPGFHVAYSSANSANERSHSTANNAILPRPGQPNVRVEPAEKDLGLDVHLSREPLVTEPIRETSSNAVSGSCGRLQSAEVLAGDIVIEEEEDEEDREEEEDCEQQSLPEGVTPLHVSSLLVNGDTSVVANVDENAELPVVEKEASEEPLFKERVIKASKPSKRRKRNRLKDASEETNLETGDKSEDSEHVKKSAIITKQKCSTASAINFPCIQTNGMNMGESKIQAGKGKGEFGAGQTVYTVAPSSAVKNCLVGFDSNSASLLKPFNRPSICEDDEVKFHLFPNQTPLKDVRTPALHQNKKFSHGSTSFEQFSMTKYHNHCENQKGDSLVMNANEQDANDAVFRTSTPWKCSPSFQTEAVTSGSGFRRTPGARRPTSSSRGSDACSTTALRQKPLFHLTGDTGHSSFSGSHCRLNSVDCSFSTPEFPQKSDGLRMPSIGVDLVVSNLDYNISMHEWKKILTAEFQQHVAIIDVQMQMLTDNTSIGYVRVPCLQDARLVISQFHRKKIGYKRIHVALVSRESPSSVASVKSEVSGLLREVVGCKLPLFKFIELFEMRYHRGISVSELYHMRDTVEIIEQDGSGRTVVLLPASSCPSPHPHELVSQAPVEPSVCHIHWRKDTLNFTDAVDMGNLPHVVLQLKTFSAQVHKLLQSHDGRLPLVSFPSCYSAEFGELKVVSEGGVSLEHLITCVPGVHLSLSVGGIKRICWAENRPSSQFIDGPRPMCGCPLGGSQQMSQFSHEVIDLLRNNPLCRMPFSKFIPAYHHHFGRQLRVADYGFTKLLELFEAIPHVAQIIGSGSRRYITLTHKAQVKRFSVDLLRILKSQASKQIGSVDLPIIYNKVIGRSFDIHDYGVCFLEDMIGELPDATFTTTGSGVDLIIAIPKRDQTPEEIERTKQFAKEAVDLLRQSPQCRMAFSKFIPAYHHHFGKQCRVSDYGFTKLIELFEAIPDIVKIVEVQEEKTLCLTDVELVRVLEEQVKALLRSFPQNKVLASDFLIAYLKMFGHSLRLGDFGVKSVSSLIKKIPSVARVDANDGRSFVCLVDHTPVQCQALNILLILMDLTDGSVYLHLLLEHYDEQFGCCFNDDLLFSDLKGIVEVISDPEGAKVVRLTPLQMFARDVRTLLLMSDEQLTIAQFEASYSRHYGVSLSPASYGFPNILALLQAVPHVVALKGKGSRRTLILMQQFRERLLPGFRHESNMVRCFHKADEEELRCGAQLVHPITNELTSRVIDAGLTSHLANAGPVSPLTDTEHKEDDDELLSVLADRSSNMDLLSVPVPSSVPSPELFPQPNRPPSSLIHFESSQEKGPDFFALSEEEKHGLRTPLCRTPVSELLAFAAQLLPANLLNKGTRDTSKDDNLTEILTTLSEVFGALSAGNTEPLKMGNQSNIESEEAATSYEKEEPRQRFSGDGAFRAVQAGTQLSMNVEKKSSDDDTEALEGKYSVDVQATDLMTSDATLELELSLKNAVSPTSPSDPETSLSSSMAMVSPATQKQGSGRRSRIAARFDLPIDQSGSFSS